MVGRSVVLLLKSPLFAFSRADGKKMPRGVVQVRGTIVKEKGPGVWLKLQGLGVEGDPIDGLTYTGDLPAKEMFIPFAKIDCFVLLRQGP